MTKEPTPLEACQFLLAYKEAEYKVYAEQNKALYEKAVEMNKENDFNGFIAEKEANNKLRNVNNYFLEKITAEIFDYKNIVHCLSNGGSITTIWDATRQFQYDSIPDFSPIDTSEIIFDPETILDTPQPIFIPNIEQDNYFLRHKCILDALRVGKDLYLVATKTYKYPRSGNTQFGYSDDGNRVAKTDEELLRENAFVILTLEQLVLTIDYYLEKAKATNRKKGAEKTAKNEKYYDSLSEKQRLRGYAQANFYKSMPKKIRETITLENWENLSLSEKEAIYKPFAVERGKNVDVSTLENDKLWRSFTEMYQFFIDPKALSSGGYVHDDVGIAWIRYTNAIKYKQIDINLQRKEISDNRKLAIETSFGYSNTNDSLLKKYGILVKNQDGSTIRPSEINDIEQAFSMFEKTFFSISNRTRLDKIKIIHTQNTFIFASVSTGMFIPEMNSVSVSGKFGNDKFNCSLVHELTHYLDFTIGSEQNRRFETNDLESLAGRIAAIFRDKCNDQSVVQASEYWSATKECLARAFEEYFAFKNYGKDAEIYRISSKGLAKKFFYSEADTYVQFDIFNKFVSPLIEEFIEKYTNHFTSENSGKYKSEYLKRKFVNHFKKVLISQKQ